jgi:hypothetical protein
MSRYFDNQSGLSTGASVGTPLSLSFFCWYRETKYDAANPGNTLIGNWGASGTDYNSLLYGGPGHTAGLAMLDNSLNGHGTNYPIPAPGSEWDCAGFTWNSAVNRFFANGIIIPVASPAANLHSSSIASLLIGARPDNLVFMSGWIAQVAVWLSTANGTDGLLTPEQMTALMRGVSPMVVKPRGLWGYWPMIGADVRDWSGNQRHLTVYAGKPRPSSYEPDLYEGRQIRRERRVTVAAALAPPSTGTFSTIKFGTNLVVTDLGSGAIRVDASAATEIAKQKRTVQILVTDPNGLALTTGDGKAYFTVPTLLNGHNLVAAHAALTTVSSSGLPTVQIANVTDSVDMLSTKISVDASELTSYTAATPPVIDTAHDDVATGDLLRVDVDVAGTGAKGLMVILTFEAP